MLGITKDMLLTGGGFAAAGGVIMATWGHISTIWRYIVGIVIGTSILKDEAGEAAMAFAFSKSLKSPIGKKVFGGTESYVHPKRWSETIAFECFGNDPVLIKHDNHYALLSLAINESSNVGMTENAYSTVSLRYFRWFFDPEKFINDAVEYYNNEKRQNTGVDEIKNNKISRFKITRYSARCFSGKTNLSIKNEGGEPNSPTSISPSARASRVERMIMMGVYRLLKWDREDLKMKPEDGKSPFTGYPFPDEVEEAIQELNGWLANEKWFRSKSIPWRRGWLLHGQPGTGKSTLTRALAMSFDLPIFIFDISGMSNNDFVESWEMMMASTPCIALIEDIDANFDGRTNIGASNPNVAHLTFDCLLNSISGVKQADGVFLIVTTNHVEKLDPALGIPDTTGKSTRPGRIDKAIHLGLMAEPQRRQLANHILSDYTELVEETIKLGEGETAAQFQSRCATLALDRFWADKKFLNKPIEVMHFNNNPSIELKSTPISKPPKNIRTLRTRRS